MECYVDTTELIRVIRLGPPHSTTRPTPHGRYSNDNATQHSRADQRPHTHHLVTTHFASAWKAKWTRVSGSVTWT